MVDYRPLVIVLGGLQELGNADTLSLPDLDVDNININGNTISVTNTDGDLNIFAHGTGLINLAGAGFVIDEVNGETGLNVAAPDFTLHARNKSGGGTRAAMVFEGLMSSHFAEVACGDASGIRYGLVRNQTTFGGRWLLVYNLSAVVGNWDSSGNYRQGGSAAATHGIDAGGGIRSRGALVHNRVTVNDANYSILATDNIVGFTALSAPRTATLPAANTFTAGQEVLIKDEAGAAVTHNITVARTGSDTIDGATSLVINTNYGKAHLYSNGVDAYYTM